jgi:hypothetical protein
MNANRDASMTTRRRKIAILNGWHNQNLLNTPQKAQTKPEQTSSVSGEVAIQRRIGCCNKNLNTFPSNERNPGGC